jgi:hypothetical protein
MPFGKSVAIAAAAAGAKVFGSGVKSDINRNAELTRTSEATLVQRLKPLLSERSDLDAAASGFQTAEDFAAAVHAARNLKVPFPVLKHLVIDQEKTLAEAIRAVSPNVDASLAADLARSEARGDISAIK